MVSCSLLYFDHCAREVSGKINTIWTPYNYCHTLASLNSGTRQWEISVIGPACISNQSSEVAITSASADPPGKNWTSSDVSSAVKSSLTGLRFCREEKAIFSRADNRDPEAGGGGYVDRGPARQHGISEQSYYHWKKQYGDMEPSEASRSRIS